MFRRQRAWSALAFLGVVSTAACGISVVASGTSPDEREDGGVAPGTDGGHPASDAEVDPGIHLGDAGVDASMPIARDDAGCPTGRGPAMLRLFGAGSPALCIDETEVSSRQYMPFVAEFQAGRTPPQRADCAGNATVVPVDMTTG